MKKSFHTTGKMEQHIENGSAGLGNFFCIVLAAIIVIWLCHDTSAGLTEAMHHSHLNPYRDASTLALILEWF